MTAIEPSAVAFLSWPNPDGTATNVYTMSDGTTRTETVMPEPEPEEGSGDLSDWQDVGFTTDGGVFGDPR